jgi:hypothetical protein
MWIGMAAAWAAIGVAYTLLVVFELWRGRGDQVWRWPIMVLLLGAMTLVIQCLTWIINTCDPHHSLLNLIRL